MALTTLQTQRWIYLIFGLSGFTGIIYESVWSHYLKLLIGHAAYAQALVLIIFMGIVVAFLAVSVIEPLYGALGTI